MKACCGYLQGGLKAVVWTDVFQAGVMLIGILIIVIQVNSSYIINDICTFWFLCNFSSVRKEVKGV